MLAVAALWAGEKNQFIDLKKPPEPKEGMEGIVKWIVYPETAKKDGITGTVYVNALILKNGTVGETEIERGVRADLDSAAVKAVRSIIWNPGEDVNGPVAVWITLPIKYQLEKDKNKK